jgi:hypothetical protein
VCVCNFVFLYLSWCPLLLSWSLYCVGDLPSFIRLLHEISSLLSVTLSWFFLAMHIITTVFGCRYPILLSLSCLP